MRWVNLQKKKIVKPPKKIKEITIMSFSLCVVIEIIMRHYTEIRENDKVYFFTPEQTILNGIVNYSR